MSWRAYDINPIDYGWEFLPTLSEVAAKLAAAEAEARIAGDETAPRMEDFWANFERAKELAKEAGWEGDYRHEPHVFGIPNEYTLQYGFVWKQHNNGSTFVVSPIELTWLTDL